MKKIRLCLILLTGLFTATLANAADAHINHGKAVPPSHSHELKEGTVQQSWTTGGADNPEYKIAVYGDTRTGLEVNKAFVAKFLEIHPELVVNTGDLVINGNAPEQWAEFEKIIRPLKKAKIPYYSALGNHEHDAGRFYKIFGLKEYVGWYAIDCWTSRFIFLDTNKEYNKGSEQYKWFVNELEKTAADKERKFLFVVFHHPPYSSGNHGNTYSVISSLCPLFSQYKVDIVFSGHDHAYERSVADGVTYIVTGGGGAPLYSKNDKNYNEYSVVFKRAHNYCILTVGDSKLKLEAFGIDGEMLDKFER